MKRIEVTYFASFRDATGQAREFVETEEKTARDLFLSLSSKYSFPHDIDEVSLSKNDDFAEWDVGLDSGDSVVFLPPVSGG